MILSAMDKNDVVSTISGITKLFKIRILPINVIFFLFQISSNFLLTITDLMFPV